MFVSFETKFYLEWWYLVREASLIVFHKYCNYLFINELDKCLCIVWSSINICEWCGVWSRYSIFRKGNTRVEIIRMCIVLGILRRYPDSTGTLDSHGWKLPISKESKEVHMILSEVWNMSPIGINYFEVWNMSPMGTVWWYMTGIHFWV